MNPKIDKSPVLPLSFSLGLHNDFNLKQGAVIVIGGCTNAGKTLMAMDILRRWVRELSRFKDGSLREEKNDNSLREFVELSSVKDSLFPSFAGIRYLNSEMTDEELGDLLADMGDDGEMVNGAVQWVRRNHDYPNAVLTDGITFLDFLQIHKDFYEIGGILAEMADRVGKGILVVFIQKKSGESFPRGGDFALERARIALLLDYAGPNVSTCYLRKIKFPKDRKNKPDGKEIDFTVMDNLALKPVSELRRLSKKERQKINESYGAKN